MDDLCCGGVRPGGDHSGQRDQEEELGHGD